MKDIAISSSGSAIEGFFWILAIIAIIVALSSKTIRSGIRRTASRTGKIEVGYKPKSRLGKALLGTRGKR